MCTFHAKYMCLRQLNVENTFFNREPIPKTKFIVMRKGIRFSLLLFAAVCFSITGIAQSVKINGSVRENTTQQTVPSVSITVKGSAQGTYSDARGNFEITVPKLPATLVVSSIGFEAQ